MKLHFVTREQYGQKYLPNFVDEIRRQYPNAYHIPEGGANVEGQLGAGEISHYIDSSYTHILLSVGSGTTFLGLRNALPYHQALLGFAPMKGGIYLEPIIRSSLKPTKQHNWSITDRFHYGGFGKTKEELILFMQEFRQQYGFDLDRVYTGKMMLGLSHLIQESYFAQGSKLLCIHTGGLTGN
jgi:1-aminocyclopropane-1-carboxylate deaminase